MYENLLSLARGPLLKLSLLLMALGLLRVVLLQLWELGWAWSRAGDQFIPWGIAIRRNLSWLLPWRYLHEHERRAYNFTSFLFHVGVIVVPLCLAGHVAIWRASLGVSWYALPGVVADTLTVVTLIAIVGLLFGRVINRASRELSKPQDWLLPVLCALPFISGWLVAHPSWSLVDIQVVYLIHLLSAELLLVLVPFSKLAHMVLFWVSQSSSELGWRFVPGSGDRVRATLGKEGQGV